MPLDSAPDDARGASARLFHLAGVAADDDPRLTLLLELWQRLDWQGRQRLLDEAERLAGEC